MYAVAWKLLLLYSHCSGTVSIVVNPMPQTLPLPHFGSTVALYGLLCVKSITSSIFKRILITELILFEYTVCTHNGMSQSMLCHTNFTLVSTTYVIICHDIFFSITLCGRMHPLLLLSFYCLYFIQPILSSLDVRETNPNFHGNHNHNAWTRGRLGGGARGIG